MSDEDGLDSQSYNKNYKVLKDTADWLSKQDEPDIDQLVPRVEMTMQAYQICKDRLSKVQATLGSISRRPLQKRLLQRTVMSRSSSRHVPRRKPMERATTIPSELGIRGSSRQGGGIARQPMKALRQAPVAHRRVRLAFVLGRDDELA